MISSILRVWVETTMVTAVMNARVLTLPCFLIHSSDELNNIAEPYE